MVVGQTLSRYKILEGSVRAGWGRCTLPRIPREAGSRSDSKIPSGEELHLGDIAKAARQLQKEGVSPLERPFDSANNPDTDLHIRIVAFSRRIVPVEQRGHTAADVGRKAHRLRETVESRDGGGENGVVVTKAKLDVGLKAHTRGEFPEVELSPHKPLIRVALDSEPGTPSPEAHSLGGYRYCGQGQKTQ